MSFGGSSRGEAAMKKEIENIWKRRYARSEKGRAAEIRKYYSKKLRIPHKLRARYALRYAVRSGKIVRGVCFRCGSSQVEAHHEDYSKPLDVIWTCKVHHDEIHHGK
jgi:hypothetical protein